MFVRQVRATLLGARHVPERLCGGYVYLRRYIKCSTFFNVCTQIVDVDTFIYIESNLAFAELTVELLKLT